VVKISFKNLKYIFLLGYYFILPFLGLTQDLLPDGIGNYWVISGSKVSKIDAKGQTIAHYSNILLGNPSSLDSSDPFRVMVFYNQNQNILFLNNDAAIIGKPINFVDIGLGEVVLSCRSSLGGIWLLHREKAELLRYNNQFNAVEQRISIGDEFKNYDPKQMTEHGGILYISLNKSIIARFDTYGAQLIPLDILHEGYFRIEANYLWVKHNNLFWKYNLNDLNEHPETYRCSCHSIPLTINKAVACFNGKEFIFCEKVIP
jgi:hypothetical protein